MKQLIITSDDFGLSPGVNTAIEKAWKDGILTCASIMPGGTAFDDAVAIARRNPGLQVGLHLTLVQGNAVLPPTRIPGLADEAGCFCNNPVLAGMRYFFDKGLYKPILHEIIAQIEKVVSTGLPLSHIDGHLNIHMHPTIFSILTNLMPQYGITSFRLSRESLAQNLRYDRRRRLGKTVEKVIFGSLARYVRPHLSLHGIRYANEVKGMLNSGRMTEACLLNIIENANEGLTEIYFHPGILPDSEISSRMPNYSHEEELSAITSPLVRKKLAELHIGLCNYLGETKQYA